MCIFHIQLIDLDIWNAFLWFHPKVTFCLLSKGKIKFNIGGAAMMKTKETIIGISYRNKVNYVTHIFESLTVRGYCTPDHFCDCLCIILLHYNTLVISKLYFF